LNFQFLQDCTVQKRWDNFTASDVNFFGCIWISVYFATTNGGAILFQSWINGRITINECTFLNMSVHAQYYKGASFYISSGESANVSSSTVTNCTGNTDAGGIILNMSSCAVVHNCKWEGCTAYGVAGGVHLNLYEVLHPSECSNHSSRGTIFGCTFRKVTASGQGGGLYYENPPVGGSIRSLILDTCTSSSYPGGIFLGDVVNVKYSSFLYYCFFLVIIHVLRMDMEKIFMC
jgi:hypothetical protein